MLQAHIDRAVQNTIAKGADLGLDATRQRNRGQEDQDNDDDEVDDEEEEEEEEEGDNEEEDDDDEDEDDDHGGVSPGGTAPTRTTTQSSVESTYSAPSPRTEQLDMQSPLRRDEVGKLLLLIARAHSTQQISTSQRSLIKGHVCRRAGYLRILLAQENIHVVMSALASIGQSGDGAKGKK